MTTANLDTLRASWGAKPPEWLLALAEECDRPGQSQGKAAGRLGVSPAVVNQALKNAYKGRLDRLEERVRGEFMREVVACPILGEISKRACLDHQGRKYSATNPLRVKLFSACKTCPNRRAE
jgi:hypothetical protein